MTKKRQQRTKLTIQLEKIKQKIMVKERRLKRYRDRIKLYKQNKTFQNNQKFLQVSGESIKTNEQLDPKEIKHF